MGLQPAVLRGESAGTLLYVSARTFDNYPKWFFRLDRLHREGCQVKFVALCNILLELLRPSRRHRFTASFFVWLSRLLF